MAQLANPVGIRVARQPGLYWTDNQPFYQKKSNYRDSLQLTRYLDFILIHFHRFLRTMYGHPPFLALGRNYNVAGFGDDRSFIIDLHYFDLFGTLNSVPRRVGVRYKRGLTFEKKDWRFFVNPKLRRQASFYNLFKTFLLGSSLASKKLKNKHSVRGLYRQFLNQLLNPKKSCFVAPHLTYRSMSNFMYLAHCSTTTVPDVALTRFKRIAGEVRLKMKLLHLIRRTKIVQKKWKHDIESKKFQKLKSKTYLVRGWKSLFVKSKKLKKKSFCLQNS